MKKEFYETVFETEKETPFAYKDIKNIDFDFQDDDLISIGTNFDDYNNECAYYYFYVERKRLETDDEYNERVIYENKYKKHFYNYTLKEIIKTFCLFFIK